MLVIERLMSRAPRRAYDDSGAVLVTIVVVMFVGFIIAATIAASVLFTIGANVDNSDRTEAFIAAESGRDAAVAAIQAATSPSTGIDCGALALTSGGPVSLGSTGGTYSYEIYPSTADAPTEHAHGDTPECDTTVAFWIIHAEGGVGGTRSVIDAVYQIVQNIDETTGGTLAYFGGTVGGQKSVYDGDLVVRAGAYECPNEAVITGDLWVTNGTVSLSSRCHIMGSIYAFGSVTSNSTEVRVDGDIVTRFDVTLSNNGTRIGGTIHAGGNVDLTGNGGTPGTVGGMVKALGNVLVSAGWDVAEERVDDEAEAPVFSPELEDVFEMTSWVDLTGDGWGEDHRVATGCPTDPTALLPGEGKLVIDYSSCSGNAITISIGDVAVDRDVVFVVPPTKTMNVQLNGNITSAGPIGSAPQFVFIHEDRNPTEIGGAPAPHCESRGPDDLSTTNQVDVPPQARLMIYTPCRLGGTVRVDFAGQFYVGSAFRGDDTDRTPRTVRFTNGARINCNEMSWMPRFERISCHIATATSGGGTTTFYTLGDRPRYQTEYVPSP